MVFLRVTRMLNRTNWVEPNLVKKNGPSKFRVLQPFIILEMQFSESQLEVMVWTMLWCLCTQRTLNLGHLIEIIELFYG